MSQTAARAYPRNFVEHLRRLASGRAGDVALIVVREQGRETADIAISYGELDLRVRSLAARLQADFEAGARALLLLDNDDRYAVAFLACLYAGLIAVPVFPPESSRPQHLARLRGIALDAGAACVLTTEAIRSAMGLLQGYDQGYGNTQVVTLDGIDTGDAHLWRQRQPADDDIAFLQYTSGSTATPKGVMISHANLMANERGMEETLGLRADDVFASWLPLYHDMGLIGGLLQPIHRGAPLILMRPDFFLARPARWLEAITRHRVTVSGGTDFAYRLCAERIKDAQIAPLDLSRWRIAYTGAEPVRHDTLAAFSARFAGVGFDISAFHPCYGLAEATLFITGGRPDKDLAVGHFSSEGLAQDQALEDDNGVALVGCGRIAAGNLVRIVDPATQREVHDQRIGEIWANGPSITSGYWNNADATEKALARHANRAWLRTGDLGFLRDGQLYVTGRIKDLIIVRGHNLYPQDIEYAIEEGIEAVRPGRVAAFAVEGPDGEGIGVAAEISRNMQKLAQPQALVDALNATVSEQCGEPLSVVALLNNGALPKTSSGKLQRQACRQGVASRSLDAYAIWEHGRFVMGSDATDHAPSASVDEIERELAAIWREVLRLETNIPLGRETHFFVAGGNSLSAVQSAARIGERWRIAFSAKTLFEKPRLVDCAAAIRLSVDEGRIRTTPAIPLIPVSLRGEPLPLSSAQRRQWFLWRLDPSRTAYHVAAAVTLTGELDIAALRTALHILIDRHEALRTVFSSGADDTGEQTVLPSLPLDIPLIDLSGMPANRRMDEADEAARELNGQPFELTAGPLLRIRIIRLAPMEHRLLIVMHHIISDAVSMQIFFDELGEAYAAAKAGRSSSLPALPIQYIDYAVWQRERFATDTLVPQLAYWRAQLGDAHPVLALSTDQPRTPLARYQAVCHRIDLPAAQVAELRDAAFGQDVTLAVFLLAAFQALLYRYTGQEDVRVGVPNANRHDPGTGGVIGFFVNTLVLRNVIGGRMSLAQALRQAGQAMLEARANSDVPFEQLVETLQPERSLAHTPLFQVLFNHLREDFGALERHSGLAARREYVGGQAAQFELALDTTERADGSLGMVFTYARELFEPATITRLAKHYLTLLQAQVTRPEQPVGEVALLSEAERQELARWMTGPAEHGNSEPVHRLIERQARIRPDAAAILFDDTVLSYAELDMRADRLAYRLIAHGVRPDSVVGIALERSVELVTALLAVLKAGGAYLPLDLDAPPERLAYMLDDSGVRLLLTDSKVVAKLPATDNVQHIVLDREESGEVAAAPSKVAVDGEHLAYVIYTSGSTGRPKGVCNRHRSLRNRLDWMQDAYRLDPRDTVLQKTPYGFDVSVWEFFWPLTAGARLAVAHPGDHRDPEKLVALICAHEVSVIHFVPSMLQAFMAHPGIETCTSLKRIICSGEALPVEIQTMVFERLPNVALDNLYGPTEAAIDVTHWACQNDDGARVPIGQPIAGIRAIVLDGGLGLVPQGMVGELYLGGVGLARGYLNRPALTAERFIADPVGAPGGRLYRTGDLVRWIADGKLEYHGRSDHQIKIRGLRVELGEIEAGLLRQPTVREAAVIVDQRHGDTRLVGYVSPQAGQNLDGGELRRRLAESLPDYMLPGAIMVLDGLPLNANGKIDRKALPLPEWGRRTQFEMPKGKVAEALAGILSEVLHLTREQISATDNFFDLGGHSLTLIRAHRLMTDRLGPVASLIDLFRYPTINALAAWIEAGAPPSSGMGQQQTAQRAQRRRAALLRRGQAASEVA
ncbi:MAG: amino acid adenylation domain-containing protein [Azoarcus sp.]|jgi:amino acid adenylation domain-containing protein|nr:amino acid adenylation domain-containing protein [Azoarcus sp.]